MKTKVAHVCTHDKREMVAVEQLFRIVIDSRLLPRIENLVGIHFQVPVNYMNHLRFNTPFDYSVCARWMKLALAFHLCFEIAVSPPTNIQHEIDASFDAAESLALHPYFAFDRFHSLVQHVLNARQQRLIINAGQLLIIAEKERRKINQSMEDLRTCRQPTSQTTTKGRTQKWKPLEKKGGNEIPRVSFGEIRIVRTVD